MTSPRSTPGGRLGAAEKCIFYVRAPVGTDCFRASLCILAAVFFVFRSSWPGALE